MHPSTSGVTETSSTPAMISSSGPYDADEITRVLAALQLRSSRAADVAGYRLGHRVELSDAALKAAKQYRPEKHAEPLTVFHSARALSMSLSDLFEGMRARGIPFENANAMIAAVLVDRYTHFTGLPVTALMVHRLFVTALLVSTKAHNDNFALNADVARAVSITLRELNEMEVALVFALRFRCIAVAEDVCALRRALGLGDMDRAACVASASSSLTASVGTEAYAATAASSGDDDTLMDTCS